MTADLFVKGARVVKPDAIVDCGLAIRDRAIAAVLAPGETVDARRTLDAGGRYVLPGLLDTHLHLGTSAQSFASDCATESRHAVTGGVTTLLPFVITRGSYFEVLPESPYEGWVARGWPDTTIAGGQVVYEKGEVVAEPPRGRYLARGG